MPTRGGNYGVEKPHKSHTILRTLTVVVVACFLKLQSLTDSLTAQTAQNSDCLRTMIWRAVLVVACLLNSVAVGAPEVCPTPEELSGANTMVAGLLSLHGGSACDRVRLGTLQQVAAAQIAVRDINAGDHNDGLTIGLHVIDTCSDVKYAVRVGFKALVLSDTTICKKSPLFLGFLGPDSGEALEAVQQLTGVFRLSHVTPLSLAGPMLHRPAALHVATVHPADKARSILLVLQELRWDAVSIVYSADSSALASAVISALRQQTNGPCITDTHLLDSSLPASMHAPGVLVFAEAERLGQLISSRSLVAPHAYLLVASQAGVLPGMALAHPSSAPLLLLQEVSHGVKDLAAHLSDSPYWEQYLKQTRCNFSACDDMSVDVSELAAVQDPSVVPTMHAMRLYARALRIAHKLKCGGKPGRCAALNNLSPDEWWVILEAASERGIRFQMDQRIAFHIYYKAATTREVRKVGNITDGGRLVNLNDLTDFPESHHSTCQAGEGGVVVLTPAPPTLPPTAPEAPPRLPPPPAATRLPPITKNKDSPTDNFDQPERTFFGGMDLFDLSTYSTLEFIVMLTTIGVCVALVFSLLICAVYSSFKVKSNNEARSRGGGSSRRTNSVRSV